MDNSFPKISIVTVNYNQSNYLEDCIKSVIGQNYPNLEYILIDGGSTDGSLEIIKKYEAYFTYWISEKDEGQYDALNKGFQKATGDIMAWLNSDDMYAPNAFFGVAEIFRGFPDVRWLTGVAREWTHNGIFVGRISPPWSRWSKARYLSYDFQFIQQESTFWTKKLWVEAGSYISNEYEFAGDLELWSRFFRSAELHTTVAILAGFRFRGGDQKSRANANRYLEESIDIITRELNKVNQMARLKYRILRVIGPFLGVFFFQDIPVLRALYRYTFSIPELITYDFSTFKFERKNYMVKFPPLLIGEKQIHKKTFSTQDD